MIALRSDVLDVPASEGTILQDRETSAYSRVFTFQNLSASPLQVRMRRSADGGATWTDVEPAFAVGAAGGGSDVVVKLIVVSDIVQIRASGGSGVAGARELFLALASFYRDTAHVWTNPLL